ncbi:unnamed protein product [Camellia sinensis]
MSFSREGSCGSLPFCYASRSASPPDSRSPGRDRRSRRSRSRSHDSDGASNPGNNLYVTGLSTRVTTSELEKYFNNEGKVTECHLVTDPRTKESRGFAFVTMETVEDAERCIKYLNHSVLEGRLITVEKAKRKRGRTPTPGRYQGLRDKRVAKTGDVLVATHLTDGTREILFPGDVEEDHAPHHMVGGLRIIALPHIEGAGNAPCQLVVEHINPVVDLIAPVETVLSACGSEFLASTGFSLWKCVIVVILSVLIYL